MCFGFSSVAYASEETLRKEPENSLPCLSFQIHSFRRLLRQSVIFGANLKAYSKNFFNTHEIISVIVRALQLTQTLDILGLLKDFAQTPAAQDQDRDQESNPTQKWITSLHSFNFIKSQEHMESISHRAKNSQIVAKTILHSIGRIAKTFMGEVP